jgi:hypothetical protein
VPELGILAFYLGRAQFNLVELFGRVNACEDGLDFPVFEVADIEET